MQAGEGKGCRAASQAAGPAAHTGGEVPGLPIAASSASLAAVAGRLALLPPRRGISAGGRRAGAAAVLPAPVPIPPLMDCGRRMPGRGGRGALGTGCPPVAALIWPAATMEAPTAAPSAGMLPAPVATATMAPAAAAALMEAAEAARGSPGPPGVGATPPGCSTAAAEAGRPSAFAGPADAGATAGGTDSVVLAARRELSGVPPAASAERVRKRRRCGGRCCTDSSRTAGTDCTLSTNLRPEAKTHGSEHATDTAGLRKHVVAPSRTEGLPD